MVMFIVSMGLMTYGAYNAGEAIYRTGFSTRSQEVTDELLSDWKHQTKAADPQEKLERRLEFYVDTLQAHIIGAGMVFALFAASWGVSFQRSAQLRQPQPEEGPKVEVTPAPAGLFWILTMLAGLTTAALGWYVFAHDLNIPLWNLKAAFDAEIFEPYRKDPVNNARMIAHLALGVSIIVLSLALAPAARFAARNRILIGLL
jgi:hypothetical protein